MIQQGIECFYLEEVKKGDILYWNVTSQCMNPFRITLCDDEQVYFVAEKTNIDTSLRVITQGYDFYKGGDNLRIEVLFNNGQNDVKQSIVCGGITDARSKTVGFSYTYCFEDCDDNDYNDAYVAVMSWRRAG